MDFQQLLSLLEAQLKTQTLLDWSIMVTALIYVYLAARENIWCWMWGIISCSLWAYADFAHYNLWVDGILQLFYVGMSAWGIYAWKYGSSKKAQPAPGDVPPASTEKALEISTLPFLSHLRLMAAAAVLTVLLGYIFDKYTPTALPYPDSFITSFSILATLLTVRKILENWLYWIVLDALAIFLFAARDAFLVSFVMVVYTIISVFGYLHWKKRWQNQ